MFITSRFRGMIAVALLAVTFGALATGGSVAKASSSEPVVWVLHNQDPNYSKPPFEDTLTALDASGQVVVQRKGFNICQTIGGARAVAASDADQTVVICENVSANFQAGAPRISKWDRSGKEVFAVTGHYYYTAANVAKDGTIFALTSKGTIYGDAILKISPEGTVLAQQPIGGFDLAIADAAGGLYLVGADIKYCDFDLRVKWTIDPIRWCATSVDTCRDGTAWVAVREYNECLPAMGYLHHVSPEGKIIRTMNLSYPPCCLRVDPRDDSVYVASGQLYKYDGNGTLQFAASLGGSFGWSLAIDPYRGGVWVGTLRDVRLISFEGKTLLAVEAFPGEDQKYVACFSTLPEGVKYGGGSGEPNSPYLIWTAEQMNALGAQPEDWDRHFKLMTDLDLSGFDGKAGRPALNVIAPDADPARDGCQGTGFTGLLDGNRHTLSHLTMAGASHVGLFGRLASGAEVRDLGVVDVNVVGSGNCVGGLVADNAGGAVTRCYSTGTVTGGSSVGGLVGNNGGTVTYCYSMAAIDGTGQYGGCGGLVGANSGSVTGSYSTGPVRGASYVGGLVGRCYAGSDATHSFWDTQTSGQATSAAGTGKTTAEMQAAQTFLNAGWDLVGETANGTQDIWWIRAGEDYPRLCWQRPLKYAGGSGTPEDPYRIATVEDLILLGVNLEDYDKHFLLTRDLDLDPNLPGRRIFGRAIIAPDLYGRGDDFYGTPFAGVFDGQGHTLSNLTVAGGHYLGLFGRLAPEAEVRNVSLVRARVSGYGVCVGVLVGSNMGDVTGCDGNGVVDGYRHVGGLVGSNKGGRVIDCHSAATVTGGDRVGGLVGRNGIANTEGVIRNSFSTGPVNGSRVQIGGLVGWNEGSVSQCHSTSDVHGGSGAGGLAGTNDGSIAQCHSAGPVSGSSEVGGLVGYHEWGDITQCYSTGAVSGYYDVGGLVGYSESTVTQCYSTGAVQSAGQCVGGLTGDDWGLINSCFWDTQTSGQATSAGGTGKTTAEMQTAQTFLDAGWDFVGETKNGTEDIWWIDEGRDYPRLWWELPEPPKTANN